LERAAASAGKALSVEADVKATGCHGFCARGPVVAIDPDDISYYHVTPDDAEEIIASLGNAPVERLLFKNKDGSFAKGEAETPFYTGQVKIALRNVGKIDPLSLDDYIARGGYKALRKALSMTSEEIIAEVEASGLRGRGGAGFPTGEKWRSCVAYDETPKYVVCNGDEGDPGAFMDGYIMEGDPHSVVEGLAICALAIGAEEGYFYIRDEYMVALDHMKKAISDAEAAGIIGDSVLNSGHKLYMQIVRGGGAFVCGESTALMASIEGRVGEPRAKYIRSVQKGLWDKPTVLNNVETLATVPVIIKDGANTIAQYGVGRSRGTKTFAMVGKVKNGGLVEVPMGVTLRQLIFGNGGGIAENRPFKAIQTGGPSGGCLPESLLDLPVDYESLVANGSMVGSGGMIVMDDRNCLVDVARYYVGFLAQESCGKCTPCREGLRHMYNILTDICEGRGTEEDIERLEELGFMLKETSLCALGKTAANPVLSTLKYFKDEYMSHIRDKFCPAGVCRELIVFAIDSEKCKSCGMCEKICPANCISKEESFEIDGSRCTACGNCRKVCHFEAVYPEKRASI
jgi:NADH-quinone oxidoreductase subunit F